MKKNVVIAGGGSAGLMLAANLDPEKYNVSIYDRNNACGRKFLVAGDGGLNLSHSEDIKDFILRYTPPTFLEAALRKFSNSDLREWFMKRGIETYVGTSKRIFPLKTIKPIEVLNTLLEEIRSKGFTIHQNHQFAGWSNGGALFIADGKDIEVKADVIVCAFGGASWKVTGSDGSWLKLFEEKEIRVLPFQPSNCAYRADWNEEVKQHAGSSLKNIVLSAGDRQKAGEVVITQEGLEGGAVYALSPALRKELNEKQSAKLVIDLKPGLTVSQIRDKFMNRGNRSVKKLLEDRLSFTNIHVALLKNILSREDFTDLEKLAEKIKALPVRITGMAELDEAISTAGGIALRETDENFQLKKIPGTYVIGEMLNWDAPTGGYLLQGCFSMGYTLAMHLNSRS